MSIESIVTICIFAAVVVFYIVRAVVAVVRAKRAGIVRVIRPHETDFFVPGVIMLVFAAGVAITELILAARYNEHITEYHETAVDIAPDSDTEIAELTKQKRSAGANGLLYVGVFTLILPMTLTSGAIVTKSGIHPLQSFSQDTFSAARKGRWIILYNPKTERIVFRVRANDRNLQFFQPGELPL